MQPRMRLAYHVNQKARKRCLPFFSSLSRKPRFEIIALKSMMSDTFRQVAYYKIALDSEGLCPV